MNLEGASKKFGSTDYKFDRQQRFLRRWISVQFPLALQEHSSAPIMIQVWLKSRNLSHTRWQTGQNQWLCRYVAKDQDQDLHSLESSLHLVLTSDTKRIREPLSSIMYISAYISGKYDHKVSVVALQISRHILLLSWMNLWSLRNGGVSYNSWFSNVYRTKIWSTTPADLYISPSPSYCLRVVIKDDICIFSLSWHCFEFWFSSKCHACSSNKYSRSKAPDCVVFVLKEVESIGNALSKPSMGVSEGMYGGIIGQENAERHIKYWLYLSSVEFKCRGPRYLADNRSYLQRERYYQSLRIIAFIISVTACRLRYLLLIRFILTMRIFRHELNLVCIIDLEP